MNKHEIIYFLGYSIPVLVGVTMDVLLSLNVYNINPEFFVSHEANREFVNFLVDGTFPPLFVFNFFGCFIGGYVFITGLRSVKKIRYNLGLSLILSLSISIFITRLSGGLSWYFNLSSIPIYLQYISFLFIILVLIYFVAYRRKKNESSSSGTSLS